MQEKLTIVLWKWKTPDWFPAKERSGYDAEKVNVAARMIKRHLTLPHQIICVTDEPEGITECDTYPLWDKWSDIRHPQRPDRLTCYRRLPIFNSFLPHVFGTRIVSMDLDMVIVGNLDSLLDRPEPFVGYRTTRGLVPRVYNGSIFMFDCGPRSSIYDIYDRFDPNTSPQEAADAGYSGTDQAWMAHVLGPNRPYWTADDGILSWRRDIVTQPSTRALPAHAKLVVFFGPDKPWHKKCQRVDWIKENWK